MPHAIIEYSEQLEEIIDTGMLMQSVHSALLHSGEFAEKDVKVRLYSCRHALVAGKEADFVHCLIYLLSGRSKATKKAIASGVLAAMQNEGIQAASISVDVRDLDREVYSKAVT